MHQRQHDITPKFCLLNPSPALKWDSTQWMNYFSFNSSLMCMYWAIEIENFIISGLCIEIQVLYNRTFCVLALLWQINTNFSWSTHLKVMYKFLITVILITFHGLGSMNLPHKYLFWNHSSALKYVSMQWVTNLTGISR